MFLEKQKPLLWDGRHWDAQTCGKIRESGSAKWCSSTWELSRQTDRAQVTVREEGQEMLTPGDGSGVEILLSEKVGARSFSRKGQGQGQGKESELQLKGLGERIGGQGSL